MHLPEGRFEFGPPHAGDRGQEVKGYFIRVVLFQIGGEVLKLRPVLAYMTGSLRTMFVVFLGLFHKVFACGMLAGLVVMTTRVNEFLSAMNRVHAPRQLVIPLVVLLRYVPTIQEDWCYIKDAMRMRDVSPLAGRVPHPSRIDGEVHLCAPDDVGRKGGG